MFQARRCARIVAVLTVMLFAAGMAAAQTSENVARIGNFGKGEGDVRTVFAAGSLVFYSIGNKVQIASFSNPDSPQKVASVELSNRIEEMVRTSISSNQYLVVSGGPNVWLVNVQSPTTPSVTATIDVGGTCEGVATSGTYAYVAAGGAGFKIYDISVPATPALVASIDTMEYCESVIISQPYAYVAAGSRSFAVNISTPASPVVEGYIPGYGGYHQFINVRSGYAYICDYDNGLQVVNVNNPASPANVMTMPTGYRTAKIYFDGNYGYVANGDSGLRIIDVTNPAAPVNVSLFDTPGRSMSVAYGAVTIGGNPTGFIFNADQTGGMVAINVSNPASPTGAGVLPVMPAQSGTAYGAFYVDSTVYVAYGTAGLRIIDVTTPGSPTLLGELGGMGEARGVVVKDGYAYVAARDSGVRVINCTNPSAPVAAGVIRTPRARGIAISGNYVYVGASDSGIAVIDVTNPASPVWMSSYPALYGENVAAGGNIVGITDYGHIRFYDFTNPTAPVAGGETSTFSTGNEGFAIAGTHAYVPDGDSLRIFDLSTLATPQQVSVLQIAPDGYCYNAAVDGNYAYVSGEGAGLRVVDVTDPANPSNAGFYDGSDEPRWVVAHNGYAYVAEKTSGLTVYNNLLAVSVSESGTHMPDAFRLLQNYPNPFNPSTTIQFHLTKPGFVTLDVQNVLGQTVATIIQGPMAVGAHSVRFDARNLSSGMYFYRLRSAGLQEVRSMLIMK